MIFELTYKHEVKSEEQAMRFFARHQRIQKKIERAFIPKISQAIIDQLQSFIDAIRSNGYSYAKANILSIVKFDGIATVIKELYHKAGFIEANFVINYIKHSKKKKSLKRAVLDDPPSNLDASLRVSLDDLAPVIDRYFQIYLLNKSALPITETTRKYIISHLVAEVDGGKDLEQAISDFTELAIATTPRSNEYAPKRARLIATTEGTRSLSFGGLIGAFLSNVDVDKVWVTCDDERVRDPDSPYYLNHPVPFPHTDLDLQESPLFDGFYNGERIMYPGDPNAHILNTIQCRCALYYKEKDDPDDDLNRTIDHFLTEFFAGRLRA